MKQILFSSTGPLPDGRGSVGLCTHEGAFQSRARKQAVLQVFALIGVCLFAAPLRAQNTTMAPRLTISAAANYVVAAKGLQLSVSAVNGRGAILRGRSYDWQISDSNIAAIDSSGMLTGRYPGPVDVTAQDKASGATTVRRFYVYPASVVITNGAGTVEVGSTLQLSAQALDGDGKAIAGVPFQWYSEAPGVARVSPEGVLTGVAEGRVTISAGLDMGPAFARFAAYSGIQVARRAAYRLKTLLSTDTPAQNLTTLVPTRVSIAGNYVAGLTSLSNGGQALLLWQNGRLQNLAATGSQLNGQIVTRFQSVAVNNQGDVAVIAETQAEWCEQIVAVFPAAAKSPLILDDTSRCSYWDLTPNAFDRQRNLVYRYSNSLFYRKADGTRQTILTVGDRPPGLGIDVVNNISNWSIAPSGKVLIELQNSANVSTYLAWDGAKFQKLFTATDQVGYYTAQWARFPEEVAPDEYLAVLGATNWSGLGRLKGGVWSVIAVSGQNNIGWVQSGYGAKDGNVFYFADSAGKTSLFRTNGTTTETLASYANWRELSQLSATGGDSVVAYGTMDGPTPKVMRFSAGASSVLLGSGLPVDGAATPAIAQASIPKGISPSGTILRTNGGALLRTGTGGLSVILKPGDTLVNGALSILGAVAGNRLGEIAFTAQHGPKWGLYTYRGGQYQMIADTDDLLGTAKVPIYGFPTADNQIAMNNLGHVAAITYNGNGNGLFLYTGAKSSESAKTIVRNGNIVPGTSTTFNGPGNVAIDESDRVAFVSGTSGGKTGLYVWDQGTIRKIIETGEQDPNGRTVNSFYSVQAAGNRFYLRIGVNGLNEYIVVDGGAVKVLASDGYTTTFGTVASNGFGSEIAANSRGDVVMPVITPSGPMLFVRRADGSDAQIAAATTRGPDGEWFLNLFGAGIGEQGDIVFSAKTWVNGQVRLALYQASASQ